MAKNAQPVFNVELVQAVAEHFNEGFVSYLLEHYDDICAEPGKYHMGFGTSIRNALRINADKASPELRPYLSSPIWLDDNWRSIVGDLYKTLQNQTERAIT
jgi:hypothetical protein